MSNHELRRVEELIQLDRMNAYIEQHIHEAEEINFHTTEQYILELENRLGDRYEGLPEAPNILPDSFQAHYEKDPFFSIPLDAQDLQASSAMKDAIEFGYANREPLPPKGALSKCHVVGITKSELSGHPLKAEEIHEGSASWPPLRYAWAQPKLGRMEVVSAISGLLPGKHKIGAYSYNFSTAHLSAAYPLLINDPREITISAQPWFSCLLGHGSGNSFKDVSGYSATITLSAKTIVGGDQDSFTVVPDNSFGLVLGLPVGGKVKYWPTLSVNLKTTSYDFIFITLTLTATTIQKAGSDGYALIDIDGATNPPGRSHYYGSGCLELPGFVLKACIP